MSLFKSTAVVSLFTFLSRISGFIRDMFTARYFGTSSWADAFYVVFKIPNFMRRLFAEGSFSLAFVPVLNDIKANQTKKELKDFVDKIAGSLLAVIIIVWMLMEIFAPQVLSLFAYSWSEERPVEFSASVDMLRITLFYFPLISLVALAGGILNSHNRFALPAATPILLNVSLIASMFFLRDRFQVPVMSLAVGVLIAGVLQLLVQIPALMKIGLLPNFKINYKDKQVKKVMTLMVPTLFGSSIAQINLLIDTIIATQLITGSVAFLYFSERLLEFPLGVFAIAISTVILPTLSSQFALNNQTEFVKTMRWALNLGFFIAIPAAIALAVMAKVVVVTLFQYGEFDANSSQMTAISLVAYMLALPAFIVNKILLPAYYSRKDTKSPVKIGIIAMLANIILNFLFVGILIYFDFIALHVGLALASAVSGWMQTFMLYNGLKKKGIIPSGVIQGLVVMKMLLASLIMAASILLLLSNLGDWSIQTGLIRFMYLLLCIAIGAGVYFASLYLMKIKLKDLWVLS
jgi:putative peptidoglycan lipid II flippase